MSVAMVSMVLDCFPSGGSLRCLAIALADAADDDGENIYKSVATLAHQSVQSERTVQRVLPTLVDGGWLELVSDGSGGRGRPTVYRIAPAWITRCAMERARARVEGRKPQRVTLGPGADGGGSAQKGVNLSPFTETEKGDKNSVKGDKNSVKGDSHGCHPNMNNELNTPLPPTGGVAVDNSTAQSPPVGDAGGWAQLLAAYPRQDVADATAASRAYTRLAPSAEDVRAMLAAIALQRQGPEWQRDGGRYVPKLSKWLRGWGEGGREVAERAVAGAAVRVGAMVLVADALPRVVREPRLTPEQMAANKGRAAELAKLARQGAARGAFAAVAAAGCGVAA